MNIVAKKFQELSRRKVHDGSEPIVMVTAYDAPTMRFAQNGNVDLVLVGDSASMVVLGNESTLEISKKEMLMLVKAVAKQNMKQIPVVADMVWGSYHVNKDQAIEHAIDLVRAGANAVKIEGGKNRVEIMRALVDAEIPVVGHVGLTPQSLLTLGSYKVQGKELEQAQRVIEDAKALAQAGASMLVLECVPDALSRVITEELDIAVIGIGAGRHVDGQVLVMHDILGIGNSDQYIKPKFVRQYLNVEELATNAVSEFVDDVKNSKFPASSETYHMADDVVSELQDKEKQASENKDNIEI